MKNGAYALAFLGSLIIVFSQSFAGILPPAATQASSDRGVAIFRKIVLGLPQHPLRRNQGWPIFVRSSTRRFGTL